MRTVVRIVLTANILLPVAAFPISAMPEPARATASDLLEGCLASPSKEAARTLARAVSAVPYSPARATRELTSKNVSTVPDDDTHPDEAQKTETSVSDFLGWDLPGPNAGGIQYVEENYRMARVKISTGELISPWRTAHTRTCRVNAPVNNAKAVLETYERLYGGDFGILIGPDRRWISIFSFDQDRYDIELHFKLGRPLALARRQSDEQGMTRLVVSDDARYSGEPGPGVRVIRIERATLLAALDAPADMEFMNEASEPVVQRLS